MKRIEQMAPWIDEQEATAAAAYLSSGAWLTEFRKTAEWEQQIADYTGSHYAVMVSSGTTALFCALKSCGIGPGDEVLVPDLTMIATANAVLLAGARPVFVDIEAATLCMDLEAAASALGERTRALLLVSLNGRTPDMQAVIEFARSHSLVLIEDAAQSLGSLHRGRHVGTFGAAGVLSFSPMKIITTGQGGAVLTDDAQVAATARRCKDFGRDQGGADFHESIGYNFKFTDLQAVVGLEQMKKLGGRVQRKKDMFALYRARLGEIPGIRFVDTDLSNTTPWFIDILVDQRDALIEHLKRQGIGTRPFYPPLHSQPAYGRPGPFPVTEDVAARGLWLPSSAFLTDAEIHMVCDRVRDFYGSSAL